jgi:hypothetical protein
VAKQNLGWDDGASDLGVANRGLIMFKLVG